MDRQQLGQLSPGDAAVALRSYIRRAGELFRADDLRSGGLPLVRRCPSGWSLGALLQATEAHLVRLDRAMAEVLHQDQPALPGSLFERPAPRDDGVGINGDDADGEQLLRRLGATLNAIADRVASVPVKDWARKARLGEEPVDAHELLREMVAFGRSTLDELAATVAHLRRLPQ